MARITVADPRTNAKFRMTFFGGVIAQDYVVVDHRPDQGWLVLATSNGKYLWLMSQKPSLPAAIKTQALANADGTSKLTISAQDLSLGGTIVSVSATDTIGTVTTAGLMITAVKNSIAAVSTALSSFGTFSKSVNGHAAFVSKLQDTLDAGVGNLVDADLAKESAKFQALQTKQQLGIQALSIASQSTSILLGLFR